MAVKTNEKDGVLIKGTSKADRITNIGNYVTISGGKGNDSIYSEGFGVNMAAKAMTAFHWEPQIIWSSTNRATAMTPSAIIFLPT